MWIEIGLGIIGALAGTTGLRSLSVRNKEKIFDEYLDVQMNALIDRFGYNGHEVHTTHHLEYSTEYAGDDLPLKVGFVYYHSKLLLDIIEQATVDQMMLMTQMMFNKRQLRDSHARLEAMCHSNNFAIFELNEAADAYENVAMDRFKYIQKMNPLFDQIIKDMPRNKLKFLMQDIHEKRERKAKQQETEKDWLKKEQARIEEERTRRFSLQTEAITLMRIVQGANESYLQRIASQETKEAAEAMASKTMTYEEIILLAAESSEQMVSAQFSADEPYQQAFLRGLIGEIYPVVLLRLMLAGFLIRHDLEAERTVPMLMDGQLSLPIDEEGFVKFMTELGLPLTVEPLPLPAPAVEEVEEEPIVEIEEVDLVADLQLDENGEPGILITSREQATQSEQDSSELLAKIAELEVDVEQDVRRKRLSPNGAGLGGNAAHLEMQRYIDKLVGDSKKEKPTSAYIQFVNKALELIKPNVQDDVASILEVLEKESKSRLSEIESVEDFHGVTRDVREAEIAEQIELVRLQHNIDMLRMQLKVEEQRAETAAYVAKQEVEKERKRRIRTSLSEHRRVNFLMEEVKVKDETQYYNEWYAASAIFLRHVSLGAPVAYITDLYTTEDNDLYRKMNELKETSSRDMIKARLPFVPSGVITTVVYQMKPHMLDDFLLKGPITESDVVDIEQLALYAGYRIDVHVELSMMMYYTIARHLLETACLASKENQRIAVEHFTRFVQLSLKFYNKGMIFR